MPEDLTLGEIARRLEHGLADLKDDIRLLAVRVDSKVEAQVLALQQAAQDERHQVLVVRVEQAFQQLDGLRKEIASQADEAKRREEAEEKRGREYRRWLIGAIVVPVIAVLLPLLWTRGKL